MQKIKINLKAKTTYFGVCVLWLFHLSAILGIGLGYTDWFIEKTPINLIVSLLLFLWLYPLDNLKKWLVFLVFFSLGMFAEWLGVNYQLLFGSYQYGSNFGPKLDGVPILIGVYWALLAFVTAAILDFSKWKLWLKIALSATLMVLLDFLMEYSSPIFDFWTFEGGSPNYENYLTWFLIGLGFQVILRKMKIVGNKVFSLHLYLAQLIFFLFAYLYF